MQAYEKLGAFYLGREIAADNEGAATPDVLYDSADLTTHAVIIGMTGSGKTGLGIDLIEEAALDNVPVIAVDPKGDLGNLKLTFPELRGEDFVPWVDAQQATQRGMTPEQFADDQAQRWQQGLADWAQDGDRIKRLQDAADVNIYTPGSEAGQAISVLASFDAPSGDSSDDAEAFAERVDATTVSILTLLGLDADALTSREYILIANILQHCWQAGTSLDMAGLIQAIQKPPIDRIGVMDLESIYPAKDRFALAMQLNNVLASPGFAAWMKGVPLSTRSLLYTDTGRPRISVLSIAHLNDRERMFFVTLLLTDIIAWMRTQPGTSSLRAILYMDELFGYMPPTANPPSKKLLLTLLKQARAFGLGLVLSTQNPMDLDYKGLSNTGTWFIGRLQTERDQDRVLDGLAGASDGAGFDRQAISATLSGLDKRQFLLHNVHETAPVLFTTRWTLSYLAGPLTREQIRQLAPSTQATAAPSSTAAPGTPSPALAQTGKPVLAPGIDEYFGPLAVGDTADQIYVPRLLGAADVLYTSKTHHVDYRQTFFLATPIDDGPVAVAWDDAEGPGFNMDALAAQPAQGVAFAGLPNAANQPKDYRTWAGDFKQWLRQTQTLTLYRHKETGLSSTAGETESDFRIRVQQSVREQRDREVARLREHYNRQLEKLQAKLDKAQQVIQSEQSQATQQTVDTAISIGTALFGAFMGRKTLSRRNVSRMGSAARRTGNAARQIRDVGQAKAKAEAVQNEIDTLASTFESDVAALQAQVGADALALEDVTIRAKSSDVNVQLVALLWQAQTTAV